MDKNQAKNEPHSQLTAWKQRGILENILKVQKFGWHKQGLICAR